ncbi:MAG: ABC transporter ATP-binding protein [Gemmatimonadetes bacterium]|nr:ABC transporter ATP-binding protein [Gemmatimonadota bacterium]
MTRPRDGQALDMALARRFARYVRPYGGSIGLSLGLLFISGALDLVGPYLTKIAIDSAIPEQDTGLLLRVVAAFVVVLVLSFVTRYFQQIIVTRAGQSIMRDLRSELFAHLQRMNLPYFNANPVGRIVTRLTSDVETMNELLTSGLVSIVADVVTLVGITVILLWIDPGLALITYTVIPPLLFASFRFRKIARDGFRATRERVGRLNGVMQETFSGIEVVKLFGREGANDESFDRENTALRTAWLGVNEAFALFFPVVQVVLAVAMALVLWGGGVRVLADSLTFGELVAFLQYVQRFFLPLRDLSEKYNVLQSAMASMERIFGILDTPADEAEFDARPKLEEFGGSIEFRNVSFHYVEGEPVLKNVSFRVRPGERVALVGATGAGKSTVFSLLLGFYEPTEGSILIDGRDLRGLDPRSLRARTGTVLQDVFLFSTDVDWNVRLGDDALTAEDVDRALRSSRAERIVDGLPAGRRERLGERGRSLSVGQRQLLSFSRALARRPDLLLLDEATSSVDSETEGLIQEALHEALHGRTCLVVAHRLSTVRDADRILVFHHGVLCEQGTHDELLRERGIYHRLVQVQFGTEADVA